MNAVSVQSINSPYGWVHVVCEGEALVKCGFGKRSNRSPSPATRQALAQLLQYLQGERQAFAMTIKMQGTPFQMKVWQALNTIPYGQTVSYGQLAKQVGAAKAARAIGGACNRNPIGIIVPCHRVVGANGALTGYAGGLSQKAKLLRLEARYA